MVLWNNYELNTALKSNISYFGKDFNDSITNVIFDSRSAIDGSLFIAKKGENSDGHNYVADVLKNPKCFAIVDRLEDSYKEYKERLIIVNDTVKSFENLAIYSRERLNKNAKVIAITGSLGKTSTKDLFYTVLSHFGKAYTNVMSFNSYFGILTTLANLPKDTDYYIQEMGMGKPGDLKMTGTFVKPQIAIITTVVAAHAEFFDGKEEEIALGKSEVFLNVVENACTILNKDNKYYELMLGKAKEISNITNFISFGKNSKDADIYLKKSEDNGSEYNLTYTVDGKDYSTKVNTTDSNLQLNVLPLLSAVKFLKLDIQKALDYIKDAKTPRGRNNLEEVEYEHNGKKIHVNIINGSYNAVNPGAFASGFDLLRKYNTGRKICIFGDIKESGDYTSVFYEELRKNIEEVGVNIVFTVGNTIEILYNSLLNKNKNIETKHYKTSQDIADIIKDMLEDGDIVFIKASKSVKTWKIVDILTGYQTDIFI